MPQHYLGLIVAVAVSVTELALPQDTVIVSAGNRPEWGSGLETVEDLRIGALEGPDQYIFGRIAALAVRGDGHIYVYDAHLPIIRQFDAYGQHVRDIGREGDGPGEYRRVLGMQMVRDSRLVIWDLGAQRITVYDSAGEYLESHRFCCGVAGPEGFAVDTSGNYYIKVALIRRSGRRQDRQWPRAFVRLTERGTPVDTLPLPLEETPDHPIILDFGAGPRVPFQEEWLHAMSVSGTLVQGRNSDYAIALRSFDGDVVFIKRTVPAARVSPEERAQWSQWIAYVDRKERERGFRHDFPEIPDRKPYFRALSVDADGRIWVDRYVEAVYREGRSSTDDKPPFHWREPNTYDLLHDSGRLLATITLPGNIQMLQSRGRWIWGRLRGDFDEEYIVRLRLIGL